MGTMPNFVPYTDGEKIPDEQVKGIFQLPPDVVPRFTRSTLIIGSRGSGKTILLRYQKETHNGLALYFNLSTEFSSITKQTGQGHLAFETPPQLKSSIPGKATAMLAISIIDRALKKGIPIGDETQWSLRECLPPALRCFPDLIDRGWISDLRRQAAITRIEEFAGLSELRPLSSLLTALCENLPQASRPLLVLLDKADQVTPASVTPIIELLDQSSQYLALVAMRPGYTGQAIEELSQRIIAGDHYDIVHLGSHPRSQSWLKFATDAICAQMEIAGIPSSVS